MGMVAENYIPGTPLIPGEDIEEASTHFTDYLFVEGTVNNVKHWYCSACSSEGYLKFPCRTYTTEEYDLYRTNHRKTAKCPKCGEELEVINLGRLKKLSSLVDRRAFIFVLPQNENEVVLRCEFLEKHFNRWREPDMVRQSYGLYRFKKNEPTEYYRCRYWYDGYIMPKTFREPFVMNSSFGGTKKFDYIYIGRERLDETFFKYAYFHSPLFNTYENRGLTYLKVFSEHPKIVELLLKFGYSDIIRCKKHGIGLKRICRFEAESPKNFFKLTKEELEAWKQYNNEVSVANTYLSLFKGEKDGFALASWWDRNVMGYYTNDARRLVKQHGFTAKELVRYMRKQKDATFYTYRDYIEAASDIGYDLTVHNVLFPKNLKKAHDEAIKNRKLIAERIENEKAQKRYNELVKKYALEKDGYLIRPPVDAKEIVAEGNALKHCVGGYASRHAEGKTTILFMRSVSEPDKPLYTIEMRGKDLQQVHGYKNQKAPKDIPEAKAFFDEWLEWVKNGSKRKKAKKKGTAETVAVGAA